eukprot:g21715.t2
MTRWLWKVWYLVLCEAVVKKVDFQMSNRFIHFLERGRGMFASNPPQQEQGPLNSFLVGCWRGVLRDRLRGFFPIEESSGGRDRYTAAGQHGVTAVLFAWSLLRSSALHSLLFLVLSLRAVVLLLRWVDFSLVVLNGQESNVADISWALFGKVQNILELMMFLLISLGWKVLRATLDVSEIRFAVAISIISFYLGIFQVACTTPSQCSYLVIIVAMNFNLQKLASAIADAPATVESGKLYRKKVTIIPWDQQWLFVLLQELRTWVIYVLLIYAYRPDPTPLRVFQLTEREASDQDELGFRCWADYELRPLSEVAQDSHAASKLFEDCWRHLEPAVASAVQKMKGKAGVLQQPDEAYYWTLHGRAVEALKLAEYLPAEQALERLVDVLGRACNITFRALPARSWWQTGLCGDVLSHVSSLAREEVTDWRTAFTGLDAQTFAELAAPGPASRRRSQLHGHLPSLVLPTPLAKATANALLDHVDLRHDFHLLGRPPLRHMTRDTAFSPLLRSGLDRPTAGLPSLKALAASWLDIRSLHHGVHSSVEDARVAMLLYRLLAPQWEVFDGRHYGPPSWTAFRRKAPRKRGSAASAVIRTAVAGELFWVEGLDGGKRNEKIEKHVGDVWHSGVRCFEVLDGPPLGIAAGGGRCLGYVYVELYGTWRGTRPLAPGALLLAPGHVYLGLHLQAPSMGMTKLLTPEDATMMAHELGHAVHMLCFSGSAQEFQDLPLDLLELPSTFAEVLATKPEVVGEYAQANPNFFAQKLQSWNVSLGLHSDFDAFAATPSELQDRAVSLWQRYSKVAASGSFSPLGEDAGGCLALGANQVAYLLCYLRTATLLRGKSAQGKSALKRWLSPDAAGKLRAQLLEQHSGFKWRKSRA